jgi:hypothetical protein
MERPGAYRVGRGVQGRPGLGAIIVMGVYDPKRDAWIKDLQRGRENPHDWLRRVWVDFIGLCAVAALGGALFYLAGL